MLCCYNKIVQVGNYCVFIGVEYFFYCFWPVNWCLLFVFGLFLVPLWCTPGIFVFQCLRMYNYEGSFLFLDGAFKSTWPYKVLILEGHLGRGHGQYKLTHQVNYKVSLFRWSISKQCLSGQKLEGTAWQEKYGLGFISYLTPWWGELLRAQTAPTYMRPCILGFSGIFILFQMCNRSSLPLFIYSLSRNWIHIPKLIFLFVEWWFVRGAGVHKVSRTECLFLCTLLTQLMCCWLCPHSVHSISSCVVCLFQTSYLIMSFFSWS